MNQAQYEAKKQAHLQKADLRKAQSTLFLKAQRSALVAKIKETTMEADKSLLKSNNNLLKWDRRAAKWSARAAKWNKLGLSSASD